MCTVVVEAAPLGREENVGRFRGTLGVAAAHLGSVWEFYG